MKILYSIQGTGNGHISRAVSLWPYLQKLGDVDFLISGRNHSLKTPFRIRYQLDGISFRLSKNGGIDYLKTFREINFVSYFKEVYKLQLLGYDFVINDFEPVSALAARKHGVPCVSLSHQASFLSRKTPVAPVIDFKGKWILKNYARCNDYVGIHFREYDEHVFTPVIRPDLYSSKAIDSGHITVYLPAYHYQKLAANMRTIADIEFHIFDSSITKYYRDKNIHFYPSNLELFQQSLLHATGVITGGGFETPAEAIYLGKKLMMIPIRHQYEQLCNAHAAALLGITIMGSLSMKFKSEVEKWLYEVAPVHIPYENKNELMLRRVIEKANLQARDKNLVHA